MGPDVTPEPPSDHAPAGPSRAGGAPGAGPTTDTALRILLVWPT
jgi:hypothetical protein